MKKILSVIALSFVSLVSGCSNHQPPLCTAKASTGGGGYVDVIIYSIKKENGSTYVRAGEPFGGKYIPASKLLPGDCKF